MRVKRRIKKARKRWVKGYNKHSTKPRVALSFYRVRKTDGEAYIARIDYIRKMAYHFAASAGQETTFFTATESARQNYGRAHNIKIRAKRWSTLRTSVLGIPLGG